MFVQTTQRGGLGQCRFDGFGNRHFITHIAQDRFEKKNAPCKVGVRPGAGCQACQTRLYYIQLILDLYLCLCRRRPADGGVISRRLLELLGVQEFEGKAQDGD